MGRARRSTSLLAGAGLTAAVLVAPPTAMHVAATAATTATAGDRVGAATSTTATERCRRLAARWAHLWEPHSSGGELTYVAIEPPVTEYGVVGRDTVLCDFTHSAYVDSSFGVVFSATTPDGDSHWGTHLETNEGVFIGSKVGDDTDLNTGIFYGRAGNDGSLNSGVFYGGPGDDGASNSGDGFFRGGAGDDTVFDINAAVFIGGPGADTVGENRSRFHGGPGADGVWNNVATGRFYGGADEDTVEHNRGLFHGGRDTDAVITTNTGRCVAVEVGC